jgi:16S rRNA (guanine(966)-N(2))-methyltransferase RsmD
MSEKIRGALFNSLGPIEGLSFLDGFAGSGAVALEAASRGAWPVHAVELNADTFEVLKHNRDLLTDVEEVSVHRANVRSWLKNTEKEFAIVLADPPYDAIGMKALDACAEAVEKGGLLVVSLPVAEHITFSGFQKIDEKRYGTAKLVFYRKK